MNMVYIAVMAISSVLMAIQFKGHRPEYGIYLIFGTCIIIFFYSVTKLSDILSVIEIINEYAAIDESYLASLIKILGIAYIAEFSSDICRDSGYGSIANQIQIFGKLTVLAVSLPIVTALFETINTYM